MASYHQTIIVGNVGKDATMRYTQQGIPVCSFSVAVTETWNDGDEKREKTTWYEVSAWRNLAEGCNQYVRKGMQIMVVGTVEASAYTNNAGQPAASLKLTAREVQFLGARGDTNSDMQETSDMPF